jgi:hypothetical protein
MSLDTRRARARFFYGCNLEWMMWLLALLFCWMMWLVAGCIEIAQAQSTPPTTTVSDTVYRADGTPAQGVLLISWSPFTTAAGAPVAAGNLSTKLGANGSLRVSLVANAGATPASTYYQVVYQLDDGTVRTEFWVVPTASPATLTAVRTTPGSTSASQLASKQYVDSSLSGKANDNSVVHLSGIETIAGTKQFSAPPSVPAPAAAGDVANKAYVDNSIASVGSGAYVSKSGDTMNGPLLLPSDPLTSNSAADKHYVDASAATKASLIGGVVPTSQLGGGSANGTLCLKGDSTWGACGTSTNAAEIQNTPVATNSPTDGQVITFDAASGTYMPKTGASANATALQGTPIDTVAPSNGQAMTFNAATGKYQPQTISGALTPGMQALKYATDFAWNQSPSTDLSTPGAKTVSLSACLPGVTGTEPQYYVYITGTGTAEAALVTGGTCTGDGAAGTLQFTTINSHPGGYVLKSASAGLQEASVAARWTNMTSPTYTQGGKVIAPPGEFKIYAPVSFLTINQTVDFTGSMFECWLTNDACIKVGLASNYNNTLDVTLINPRGRPTQLHGAQTMIAVYGQKTRIQNLMTMGGVSVGGGNVGMFGSYIQVIGDQAFLLDGVDTTAGWGLECNATQCGTLIVAPGPFGNPSNAAVGWIKNAQISMQCMGNGVETLFANRSGAEKKESAVSFITAALQIGEAVSSREIVDEPKFREGLSKIIDGAVDCFNSSAWAKAK